MGEPPDPGIKHDSCEYKSTQENSYESSAESESDGSSVASSSICETVTTTHDSSLRKTLNDRDVLKQRRRAMSLPKPLTVSGDTLEIQVPSIPKSNGEKDYENFEAMYEEFQRKLNVQEERFQKKIIQLTTDYETINEELEEKITKLEKGEIRRDKEIIRLNDEKTVQRNNNGLLKRQLKDLKEQEDILNRRLKCQGDIIVHMKRKQKAANKMKKIDSEVNQPYLPTGNNVCKCSLNIKECDERWKKIVTEKDEEINVLKAQLASLESYEANQLHKINSNDNMFRIKPKRKASSKTVQTCEFPNCDSTNVDLIKCNICSKWVCEDCNEVSINKLKPIMDKCKTIFFICRECSGHEDINVKKAQTETVPSPFNVSTKHDENTSLIVSTLETTITEKVSSIEKNLTDMLTSKFEENMRQLSSLSKNLKSAAPVPVNLSSPDDNSPTKWSSIVAGPTKNFKSVMRDARNDEKLEQSEKELRSKNLIIHGADEIGKDEAEIKKEDTTYVKEILQKIGLNMVPTLVVRLGKSTEGKNRPIKIVMKSKEEQNRIMENLHHLKGTERYFGKISIKDDYTISEREEIKLLTERAKEQSTQNPERIYRVRGNSKNGWRIVSYLKQ